MSTPYAYYEGPECQPVLADCDVLALSPEETASVVALVASNPVAVRAAHVYERSDFFAADDFAHEFRNPSYSRENDDIVVQVTMVLRHREDEGYDTMKDIYARLQADKAEADLAAAEEAHSAAVAARKAAVEKAEAAVEAARTRLAKVKGEA